MDAERVSSWGQSYGRTASFVLEEASPLSQPTYDADGLNGLPTIAFDGLNDRLVGNLGNLVGNDNWTVLFVGQTLNINDSGTDPPQAIFAQPNGFTSAGGGLKIAYRRGDFGWYTRHRDGIGGADQNHIEYPAVGTPARSGGLPRWPYEACPVTAASLSPTTTIFPL